MLSRAFRDLIIVEPSALRAHRAEIESIFNELKAVFPTLFDELESELNKVLSGSTSFPQLSTQSAELNSSSPQSEEANVEKLRNLLNTALEAEKFIEPKEGPTEFEESKAQEGLLSVRQSDQGFYDAIFNVLIALAWEFPLNQKNAKGQPYDDLISYNEDESLTLDNAVATPDGRLHNKEVLNEYFTNNNAFDVTEGTVCPRTPEGKKFNARVIYYLQRKGITIRIPAFRELDERRGHGGQRLDQPPLPPLPQAQLLLLQSSPEQFQLIFLLMTINENSLEASSNVPRDELIFHSPRREQSLADLEESSTGYKISLFINICYWGIKILLSGLALYMLGIVVPVLIIHGVSSVGLALACTYQEPGSYKEKLTLFFQAIFASYKESVHFCLIGAISTVAGISLGLLAIPVAIGLVAVVLTTFAPALLYLRYYIHSNAGEGIRSCIKFVKNSILEEKREVMEVASLISRMMSVLSFQNAAAVTVPPQSRYMSTTRSLLNNRLAGEEGPSSSFDLGPRYHRPLFSFQGVPRSQFVAAAAAVEAARGSRYRR